MRSLTAESPVPSSGNGGADSLCKVIDGHGPSTAADASALSSRMCQSGWPSTLTTTPLGSRTKKRRGPHGSSVSGWTIS